MRSVNESVEFKVLIGKMSAYFISGLLNEVDWVGFTIIRIKELADLHMKVSMKYIIFKIN